MSLNNKNILITGTSSGIGKYLAEKFLENGYNVTGISRSSSINHNRYLHINCDLRDVSNLDKKKLLKLKNIYFFIHNAGIHGPIGKFNDLNFQEWKETFEVNLFSGAYILQILIKNIIQNKGGCIFIAGGGSANSMPYFTAYSSSKTALVRFVENISEEYSDLRAHCISPGPNKTKLLDEAISNGIFVDKKRIVNTEEVFDLCNFLISNYCKNLSGRQIHVRDDYSKLSSSSIKFENYKLRRLV